MDRFTERNTVGGVAVFPQCEGCSGDCIDCITQDMANEKLKHYEDLEEQGLLIKLPCKVGDVIYCFDGKGRIGERICKELLVDEDCKMVWAEGKEFACWIRFERFGKIAFLTKEEAEANLKEYQGVKELRINE